MDHLDWDKAASNGWKPGAYLSGETRGLRPLEAEARVTFYLNPHPVRSLLDPDARMHAYVDVTVDNLKVVVAELVRRDVQWSPIEGYLLLHLEMIKTKPEIGSMAQLARVARTRYQESRDLITAVRIRTDGIHAPWAVMTVPRVFSASLSPQPDETDRGMVRWDGSDPVARRIVSLATLPKDGRQIAIPFALESLRPTPSYALSATNSSVAVVRVRKLNREHVTELRTMWIDALLTEVVQRDAIVALTREVSSPSAGTPWKDIDEKFRSWRMEWGWQATTDHAMEDGLALAVRRQLGTQELIDLLLERIGAHASAESAKANERLTAVVTALTFVAAVLPISLALATRDWRGVLGSFGWWISVAALLGLAAWVRVRLRRGR